MTRSPQESSTALDLETPRRDAVRTMGVAGAALLGALGLTSASAISSKGKNKKTRAAKKSKKARSGPAGPAGLQGPAGPGVGLAGLTFVVQQSIVTSVNGAPGSAGSAVFNCPAGGVITSVSTDLREDVADLGFMTTASTGPGNLTVTFTRGIVGATPALFVATVVCLVAG